MFYQMETLLLLLNGFPIYQLLTLVINIYKIKGERLVCCHIEYWITIVYGLKTIADGTPFLMQ